ncbi:hypothetical protein [Nocardia callitridis]|uniref:Uncharacterized protein n=1 Tax=Nocardia callitridis TaxID=648753 RepID=A0ABP9KFP6_9NOCA
MKGIAMDRKALAAELAAAGQPPGSYRITDVHDQGDLPTDFWFLRTGDSGKWEVGAYERGTFDVRSTFDSEDEACRWMYRTLTGKEPTP